MTTAQRSGYFRLAVDLLKARHGTIPHPYFTQVLQEDAPMFQPKDRVTVPNADGRGRLPATVVMVLSENYTDTARAPYAVMVAVDGARPGSTEAHPLADVQPIEDDIIEDCAEESYPTLREQAYDL